MNAVGRVAMELGEDAVGAVEQPQPERGSGDCRELVGDAETGDDAENLVIEMYGTRLRIHGGPAIEHEAFDAVLRQ
jgi:hypothetical protein